MARVEEIKTAINLLAYDEVLYLWDWFSEQVSLEVRPYWNLKTKKA
ncbi:hypothetical protein [Candidatus Parabeggiatoa sp. HSG14]